MREIEQNSDLTSILRTKPFPDKLKAWKTPWWKNSKEREIFKDDIMRCKYAWYKNKEISEYFKLSITTIDWITKDLRDELKTSIQTEDRQGLLFQQVNEIDEVIADIKRDISRLKDKERNLKIKYLTILDKYLQERAVLLWLRTSSISFKSEVDPIDKLIQAVKDM